MRTSTLARPAPSVPQSRPPRPPDAEAVRGILFGLLLAIPVWLAIGILVALVL